MRRNCEYNKEKNGGNERKKMERERKKNGMK